MEKSTELTSHAEPALTGPPRPAVQQDRSTYASVAIILLAVAAHACLQAWSLLDDPRGPLQSLRTFVIGDQLGYMAMSVNISEGQFDRFEPYTETGLNTYPPAYYAVMGLLARFLDLGPVTAWNALALTVQSVMVAVLAHLTIRLSGRVWAGLLAPLVFLVGPLAWLTRDEWFVRLDSHAVLWGPYGAFTALNAESVGLSLGALVLALLALAWVLPGGSTRRLVLTGVSAALVGATANVHTYSFFTIVFFVAAILSIFVLYEGRRWGLLALSAAGLVAVYLTGERAAEVLGQLPTLVLGLAPFVPGMLYLIRKAGLRVLPFALLTLMGAAPQILTLIGDLRSGDPFLEYRVASSRDLGVVHPGTLLGSLPLAIPLLMLLAIGLRRRLALVVAVAGGSLVAWLYLATNDMWGANAEPYRLWIDGFVLSGVLVLIAFGVVVLDLRTRGLADTATGSSDGPRRQSFASPSYRRLVLTAALVSTVLAGLTLPDYTRWATDPWAQDLWSPSTSRMQAVGAAAAQAADGSGRLVLTDPCVNPQTAKVLSGAPFAYYRLGLAWPERRQEIGVLMWGRNHGSINARAVQVANVGWILSDSACDPRWLSSFDGAVEPVAARAYEADLHAYEGAAPEAVDGGGHRIILWRVTD